MQILSIKETHKQELKIINERHKQEIQMIENRHRIKLMKLESQLNILKKESSFKIWVSKELIIIMLE